MGAHSLNHEILVSASLETVEKALTTAEGLRGWNTTLVEGSGKVGTEWLLNYTGRPHFAWRIDRSDAREILWTATAGPGDSVGTTVTFTIAAQADGRTLVGVSHGGWPHDEANFTKCNTIWGGLMHHFRAFVESGTPSPAFS